MHPLTWESMLTTYSNIWGFWFCNGTCTKKTSMIELASQASHIILYKHFWTNDVLLHMYECSSCTNTVNTMLIQWELICPSTPHTVVVSNRWTGLWTGLLDWTAGLDYLTDLWTKIVCITWPPPNQMCWIGSHVWCLDCRETKDVACSNCGSFVPRKPWRVCVYYSRWSSVVGQLAL